MAIADSVLKRTTLAQITNSAKGAGLGWYGGRLWVNGGGLRALALDSTFGTQWFVSTGGSDSNDGLGPESAFLTVGAAVNAASAGDTIIIAEGAYDEAVTIPYAKAGLILIGVGARHAIAIAPSTAAAVALTVVAASVTIVNLDIASPTGAAHSARVSGSGFAASGCKFEGADTSGRTFGFGPGTIAQIAAHTFGRGGDCDLEDCEFAWGYDGIGFIASDFGAATQVRVAGCYFHNLSHGHLVGVPGAFGIGSVRNLIASDNTHDRMEDGTASTTYVNFGTNSDTGIITRCSFPHATNATGLLVIGTGLKWVANATEAGWSTARPA